VRNWMEENGILPYQADGTGLIRHIMVRKGFTTGDLMVVVIAASQELPSSEDLTKRLMSIDGFKSLVLNINDRDTNVILGDRNIILYGTDHIEDNIAEFKFRISPHSFFQVNPKQTQVMYAKALEYAGLTGNETVFDAYCGAGTISMFLSKKAKQVYGVEIVKEAVTDARLNAEMNGVTNIEFIEGKSEDVIAELIEQGIHADVVVVDPPRKGCERSLLESIAAMGPQRFVYVSCDAATLGRDIGIMTGLGYGLVEATPVDNFPQTAHVETVALMSRVKK
ncbi:MAG: 23S rRNA (uracil(1939)-C(5))-methyltransferase RlmD, partial [Youngiibacter sp.]|nr:23S rRNA (uracil(1939)-C(5))-methyltransferase RlmD [Youngiibacter sp.]